MVDIQIVNTRELKAVIERAPAVLRQAIRQRANLIRNELRRDLRAKITPGGLIEPRSRKLYRSVFSRVRMTEDGLEIRAGATRFTANILEKGATIAPTKAAHVTVPLPFALDGRGLKLFSARDFLSSPGSYGYTGSFTRGGVIFGRLGDDAVPLFALKKQVRIEPRRFIASVRDARQGWVVQQFRQAVTETVDAIWRGGAGAAA